MRKETSIIPVNIVAKEFNSGIFIGKYSVGNLTSLQEEDLRTFHGATKSHRDDYHLFFLPEKGTLSIEIDFKKYKIKPSSVIYIHPNQVHCMIRFENVTVSFWVISNDNLHPEYLKLLDAITPAKPLSLKHDTFAIISEAVSLSLKLSERKHEKLYHSLVKDSCNTLIALIASQYLGQSKPIDTLPRFEMVTKTFRAILEKNFVTAKRPAEYAQKLNLSTSYLNECVKQVTGYSVSHHIQQRILLEAKRLLYHTNKSVKEISTDLGYDDYAYFSRLFTKAAGQTALTFRNKNRE